MSTNPTNRSLSFRDLEGAAELFRTCLIKLGFDLSDPHLQNTPMRFVKALDEMTSIDDWNLTTFPFDTDFESGQAGDPGIIIQKDIPVVSLCAHHLAPFTGTAIVAYIPNKNLVGLSKLARTIQLFSASLTTQEAIGQRSADFLMSNLSPKGVAVIIKAHHSCMSNRGAKAHGAQTITSTLRGEFYTDPQTRAELFQMIRD
jgi:GTP cyclohydrolase I